ncbi:MAG: toll/interleukin-1 receptor domain-containing protein [Chloroflexi bacterium]|nr:toll/interleukin-1 receptor domain-containing protein [Chloroflexota bacterium]
MANTDQQVYISYAWGGESERIANELDADLQENGITIIRDKRDLGYKGSISEFMQEIGRGNAIIVIVSDKYLKSPNCMYELVEIAQYKNIHDRIFPIVLGDADIYNPVSRIKYIKHWEDKLKELDEAMKSVSSANLDGLREELDSYDEIRDNVSELTYLFKDMNTLTPDMHEGSDFARLISILRERLGEETENKKAVSHSAAPKEREKPEGREKTSADTKIGSVDEYLEKVVRKLVRDDYQELEYERFGELRLDMAFERKDKYKMLLIPIVDYHRFLFLYEADLDEDRLIELENEFEEYCAVESKNKSAYVYTFGMILTDSISDEVKELMTETTPAEYDMLTDLAITAVAIYSADEHEIYYPKSISEKHNSDFSGKIKNYLRP